MILKRYIDRVSLEISKLMGNEEISYILSELITEGAFKGRELNKIFKSDEFSRWLERRLKFQLTLLKRSDYYNLLLKSLWYIQKPDGIELTSSAQYNLEKYWFSLFRNIISFVAVKKFFFEKLNFAVGDFPYSLEEINRKVVIDHHVTEQREKLPLKYSMGVFNFAFDEGAFLLPEEVYEDFDILIFVKNEISRINLNAILEANSNFRRILKPDKNFSILKNSDGYGEHNPKDYILPLYLTGFIFKKDISEDNPKEIRELGNYKGVLNGRSVKEFCLNNPLVSMKYVSGGENGVSDQKKYLLIGAGTLNWGEDMWKKLVDMLKS